MAVHGGSVSWSLPGKAARSLPSGPESTRLDIRRRGWREERSSAEPNTEQTLGGHWFPFISRDRSRFVGMRIPFEQTIGMCGIADHRTRPFRAAGAPNANRDASVDRIKDENQEKWLVTATNRRDALTTYVQFAKSLLSVIDSQAALERTDASSTIERDVREEPVNGTPLTLRIAFAVTRELRPFVRLFTLAPNAETSLMWLGRSSEVVSSRSCLGAEHSACFARRYCKGPRLLRSSTSAGLECVVCASISRKYSAGHPFSSRCPRAPGLSLHRGTRNGLLVREWERSRERPTCAEFLSDEVQALCIADVARTKDVDDGDAWRDSLQEHGSRTVSSYSRWSPPDRRGRSS